jgi:hypothetical protein
MTTLTLFPDIRDYADLILGRLTKFGISRSGSRNLAESRRERREMIDEMLMTNPEALASEFGMQWMGTTPTR